VASLDLNGLTGEKYDEFKQTLFNAQLGSCFICEQPIDLVIQALDVDHVEPLTLPGSTLSEKRL
jgi:hypothetical protein